MRDRIRGFSRLEMLVVMTIVGAIVALGAPMLKSGRIPLSRGERMAVCEMQSVVQEQARYRERFGKYATSLDQLGMADKDGYLFAMVLTRTGYAVVASPRIYLIDGRRTFYVNQSGVVRESRGERPASGESAAAL
jgi:prepilin-type N-terminal cleavage/methylation domain-containing protein